MSDYELGDLRIDSGLTLHQAEILNREMPVVA
jgi:hypothetical protein